MPTVLVTILITLLGAGPAPKAWLVCEGLMGYGEGRDEPRPAMRADSRGAIILEALPGQYACRSWLEAAHWSGTLTIDRDGQRLDIALQETT